MTKCVVTIQMDHEVPEDLVLVMDLMILWTPRTSGFCPYELEYQVSDILAKDDEDVKGGFFCSNDWMNS